MKFTIVTICYNAEQTIEKTMKSVLSQTFTDYEYLIQDGASTDGTIKVVKKMSETLPDIANKISVVSESDSGLYNAMNKATERATGDYIIFMNSGDVFASDDVLERVDEYVRTLSPVKALKRRKQNLNDVNNSQTSIMYECSSMLPDIIFGNVTRIKPYGEIEENYSGRKPLLKLLLTGNIPSHQSTFTKTEVMKKLRFDESFRITADFDFYTRAYSQKLNIEYMSQITVSKVDNTEGVSSNQDNLKLMRAEDDRSLKINLPVWYCLIRIPKGIYRFLR